MMKWQKEDKTDKIIKVILFLISPFLGAVYSVRAIKTKSSFVIFFLFAIFFGMSFTVPLGKTDTNRFDGASYREKFERYIYYYIESDYLTSLKNFLFFNEDAKDYYFFSLSHFVSKITENYHVLFMIIAIIFAFFALKSLKFLVLEEKFQVSIGGIILVYMFMINDIFNINGVRFWTAAWVGVYCIFQIFKNNNKRFFLLALLTPLIHISFWIFFVVIVGAYFVKKAHKPWVTLFVISFFISNLSVELVRGVIDSLPSILANMAEVYTEEDYLIERANRGSGFYWVTEIFKFLTRVYMNLLVWLFIQNSTLISSNPKTKNLFSFLLIWMTFVNFTMPIPSLGGRFMAMSYPIIAYIWLVNFYNVKYQKVLYLMPVIFLISFYKSFNGYTGVQDLMFFFSSPIYLIYENLIIT